MAIGKGSPTGRLTEQEARAIIEQGIPASLVEGKRVLVLTPDATRTAPLPMMVRLVNGWIGPRAKALDFMVALGTHQPLSEEKLLALYGITPADREGEFARCRFLNHRWDRPDTLRKIGTLPASSSTERKESSASWQLPVTAPPFWTSMVKDLQESGLG